MEIERELYKTRCMALKEKYYKPYLSKFEYYKALNNYDFFKDILSEDSFKRVIREKNNRKSKRYRANQKLRLVVDLNELYGLDIVFCTCTFNDYELSLKEETRKKHLNRWINENFLYSVANVDYGKKNEREHYHIVGILQPNKELESIKKKSKKGFELLELKEKKYKLGFEPTFEIAIKDYDDLKYKKISNYLLKINNHSNKKTTKNRRFVVHYDKDFFGLV